MEAAYWFSSGGDYDGMVVWLLPKDQAAEALNMMTRASGNFSNTRTLTAMTAQEIDGESQDCEVGVDAADGDYPEVNSEVRAESPQSPLQIEAIPSRGSGPRVLFCTQIGEKS